MLLHKRTNGLLVSFWNEEGSALVDASFHNLAYLRLNEDEWCYVSSRSAVGKMLILHYPYVDVTYKNGKVFSVKSTRAKNKSTRAKKKTQKISNKRTTVKKSPLSDTIAEILSETGGADYEAHPQSE